ncbi:MAG: hypothetical protein ITG00_02880 [Flavobacterium sp.]|nr:hypothetical protein [Flavobacterium sp.]
MKKIICLAVFAGLGFSGVAQDKSVEFKPAEKHKFVGWEHTSNGLFYIVTGKAKSDVTINSYDADLNLAYEKNIETSYKGLSGSFGGGMNDLPEYYDLYASKTGQYAVSYEDRLIIDRSGKTTKLNYVHEDESGEIHSYFTFYSDDYMCYLGKKPSTGRGKNKIDDPNIYLFRRSISDQSTKLITLPIPEIATDEEKLKFGLHSYTKDGFYIVNKQLDKVNAVDIYNILNYNYDGQLISSKQLDVRLNGKYFAASNCGFGSSTIIYSQNTTTHRLSDNATGNIYIDQEKQVYYVFGVYTNSKDTNLYNSKNNGFYVKKFSFDGQLIWDSENEINDKDYNKNAVSFHTQLSFFKLNDGKLGIRISNSKHHYAHMFLLNELNGEVLKNKKTEFDVSVIKLNGIRGGSFPTGYSNKTDFGGNSLNVDTFFAAFASDKVDAFFKSVKDRKNNYNAFVLENGIYVLEENPDKDLFRLMKFNW